MHRRNNPWNRWCAAFAGFSIFGAGLVWQRPAPPIRVLIGGDTQGYLSPCGCTFPMTGGIRRMATAVEQLRGADGIFIENGGLVGLDPPHGAVGTQQNELKAETMAEALSAMHVDALNLGREEASGGSGMVSEIRQLASGSALSTSVSGQEPEALPRWIEKGSLLIGGVTPAAAALAGVINEVPVSVRDAVHDLVTEAAQRGKTPVLMLRAGLAGAQALATAEPSLALIVYQTTGTAPPDPIVTGRTLLVTPGDRTKNLVTVEFDGTRFGHYNVVTLTPAYNDQPQVSKIFDRYTRRVDSAHLIEALVRSKSAAFAGSQACAKCHPAAFKIWHLSKHANALLDLEHQGQARDPDCLACHVTGLSSTVGFRTRLTTPRLANVTCESCHGPAAAHVSAPERFKLPIVGQQSCLKCHTSENSPNFVYKAYWARVIHR